MRVLISGCTVTAAAWMGHRPDRLGALVTPRDGNRIPAADRAGAVWAADNDCFQGLHAPRFLRLLARIVESGSRPLWVAAPDVVADAAATGHRFDQWEPAIHALGLPVALVAQDGLTPTAVPWDRVDCVFVGGSTRWKLGDEAAAVVQEAKGRGVLTHAGRVNSLRRIAYFAALGVDTFDGTGWSNWGDKRIGLAVRWIDRVLARRQAVLFGGNA